MSTSYTGPAKLQIADVTVEVETSLSTVVDEHVTMWAGSAVSLDLAALRIGRDSGTLTLPDGTVGDVYVAHSQVRAEQSGVSFRLHGSGPAPYEGTQ